MTHELLIIRSNKSFSKPELIVANIFIEHKFKVVERMIKSSACGKVSDMSDNFTIMSETYSLFLSQIDFHI